MEEQINMLNLSIYDYDVFKAELSTSGKASFKNNGTLSKIVVFCYTKIVML